MTGVGRAGSFLQCGRAVRYESGDEALCTHKVLQWRKGRYRVADERASAGRISCESSIVNRTCRQCQNYSGPGLHVHEAELPVTEIVEKARAFGSGLDYVRAPFTVSVLETATSF